MSLINALEGLNPQMMQGLGTQPLNKLKQGLNTGLKPDETGAIDGMRPVEKTNRVHGVSATPSFGETLQGLIEMVDSKQKDAVQETRKIIAGESDNLHQSMIASQEASVAFTLMIEVRNKLVEAYQELARMQA